MGASSTAQSEVMVTRSGVYLYELKVQTGDFTSEYAEMAVLDSAGNTKKSYEFWTDWEVAPHYRFLNLEAGDIVYNYGINKAEVKNVYIGTQFSLRLLSNYIQPDIAYTVASTSAPSYCDLNPNSWWCYYYGYYYY
nr:hypothetical protein BaRGS_021741 [Batillaria attramentaria]